MKILVYSDCHWSSSSSIIRGHGEKYSIRLENLIKSVNWAEKLSLVKNVDMVVCNGDFFDKSSINSEEITALTEVEWNLSIPHVMLIGNHEMWSKNLQCSSASIFQMLGFEVIDSIQSIQFPFGGLNGFAEYSDGYFGEIFFIPYTEDYDEINHLELSNLGKKGRVIGFSHNDIAGIQMGKFLSKNGFSVEDIESKFDLFFNGHLHNGEKITDKIINIGNLTGQNFNEDATRYKHGVIIVDTDTMTWEFFENPHAFNLYKLRYDRFVEIKDQIKNGVVCISCPESLLEECKETVKSCENIISYRITIERERKTCARVDTENVLHNEDHLLQFKNYILSEVGDSDMIKNELLEVCR